MLLDHNVPHKLRTNLGRTGRHEFVTASFLGWGHLKNGELLAAAEDAAFEVLVSGDRTLVHEQNLDARRIVIIALSTNNCQIIKDFVSQILTAIQVARRAPQVSCRAG